MISSLNDIKIGLNIIYNDEPYQVLQANFVRMQQRKPVMQTKIKNLISGKVLEINFKPGDKIQEADIERKKVNFLYRAGEEYIFMDNDSYEQFSFSKKQLEEKTNFLKDGGEVQILTFNNNPINIELPPKMDFKIINTAPGIRGDTAQGRVTKPATIETGYLVNVPIFIKESDIIKINTKSGEYVERVNQ